MERLCRIIAATILGLAFATCAAAADQRIQYTERMVGANHPSLPDTLNRLTLIEHDSEGKHGSVHATDVVTVGPWIDSRAYANLPAAFSAATSTGKTLHVFSGGTISTSATYTARVRIDSSATVTILSGQTFTFGGAAELPLAKVFSCSTPTCVSFTGNSVAAIYPQWWGAAMDGQTNDTFALQAALQTAARTGLPIRITGKLKTDKVTIPLLEDGTYGQITIIGNGPSRVDENGRAASQLISAGSVTGDDLIAVQSPNPATYPILVFNMEKVAVIGPDTSFTSPAPKSGNGVNLSNTISTVRLRDVEIRNFKATGKAGLMLGEGYYGELSSNRFIANYYGAYVDGNVPNGSSVAWNVNTLNNNSFRQNAYGMFLAGAEVVGGVGNLFESNTYTGLRLDAVLNSTWASTYFENNNTAHSATDFGLNVYNTRASGCQYNNFLSTHVSGTAWNGIQVKGTVTGGIVGTRFLGGYGTGFAGSTDKLFTVGTYVQDTIIDNFAGMFATSELVDPLSSLSDSGYRTQVSYYGKTFKGFAASQIATITTTGVVASQAIDMSLGNHFVIFANHAITTIAAPTNAYVSSTGNPEAQQLIITVYNGTGAFATTMNAAYKLNGAPNFPDPGIGNAYTITFKYYSGAWREISRSLVVAY